MLVQCALNVADTDFTQRLGQRSDDNKHYS